MIILYPVHPFSSCTFVHWYLLQLQSALKFGINNFRKKPYIEDKELLENREHKSETWKIFESMLTHKKG